MQTPAAPLDNLKQRYHRKQELEITYMLAISPSNVTCMALNQLLNNKTSKMVRNVRVLNLRSGHYPFVANQTVHLLVI